MGGDPAYIDPERIGELCRVKRLVEVYPERDGYLAGLVTEKIGIASISFVSSKIFFHDRPSSSVRQRFGGEVVVSDASKNPRDASRNESSPAFGGGGATTFQPTTPPSSDNQSSAGIELMP